MRIAACQTPEVLGDVAGATALIRRFAADADDVGVDLLLFPECFLQGYLVTPEHVARHAVDVGSAAFDEILGRLRGIRQTIVVGVIEGSGGAYFNTAVVIRGGAVVGRYRKRHLTPGESVFTAGDDCPVFECAGTRFGINICYDMQFPAAAAEVAVKGAAVLLVPAQNMMPRAKALHWQDRHQEIRLRRVHETGLWLASADVTGQRDADRIGLGPTCVTSPAGVVVARVPSGAVGMAVADVGV